MDKKGLVMAAALVSATPVTWFLDRPWLQLYFGLYPAGEALLAQSVVAGLLAVLLIGLVRYRKRPSPARERA